jgi:hypothetical protein
MDVHASQLPVHTLLQQTPSAQNPLVQSEPARHFSPVPHFAQARPPQSTSVSLPPLKPFAQPQTPPEQTSPAPQVPQLSVAPQPSLREPQFFPDATQVVGLQQVPLVVQLWPLPQGVPAGSFECEGDVPTHLSSVQGLLSSLMSVGSGSLLVLPLPLHTKVRQSPAFCLAAGSGVPLGRLF